MNSEENRIIDELINIFNILKKHTKMILFTTIITVVIVFIGVTYVVKPKYQSTAEIIINQKLDKDAQASELQQVQSTDLQLVNTYKSILNSQTISSAVRNKIGKSDFNRTSMNVNTDISSQVIGINVTSDNPELAKKVANLTASTFKVKIKSIMNVNNVSVISKAQVNKTAVYPKKTLSLIIGALVGVILGGFASFFSEINDKKVSDREFITKSLGLLDLGEVSDINMKSIGKKIRK